jgi:chromosome segregation ATPase
VQTSLAKNFTILLRRINRTDQVLSQQAEQAQLALESTHQTIQRLETIIKEQEASHACTVEELSKKINELELSQQMAAEASKELPEGIKRLSDDLINAQLQFEEKIKRNDQEWEDLASHMQTLALEQNRLNDEISKKENKVEAERIIKETEILKDKNNFIENELKLATHKIEKMEILSEKAERLQAKKDLEFMKEIEERVKKELKISVTPAVPRTSTKINPTNSYTVIQGNSGGLNTSVGGVQPRP